MFFSRLGKNSDFVEVNQNMTVLGSGSLCHDKFLDDNDHTQNVSLIG
jgi:hypothetical protein